MGNKNNSCVQRERETAKKTCGVAAVRVYSSEWVVRGIGEMRWDEREYEEGSMEWEGNQCKYKNKHVSWSKGWSTHPEDTRFPRAFPPHFLPISCNPFHLTSVWILLLLFHFKSLLNSPLLSHRCKGLLDSPPIESSHRNTKKSHWNISSPCLSLSLLYSYSAHYQ